tara:strand:- start:1930 stop:2829 length:900 start_codon:yes stop_codon:yes gene_type:complete
MEGNNVNEDPPLEEQNNPAMDYTVEMDVSSINHLLNMYNVNPSIYNTTPDNITSNTVPYPIPFSSLNTYSHHCPADNITQMYDNIEPLYVSEVKDMKNNIIDILNHRSDFKEEEFDDEKYENKEIDELYEKIRIINYEFKIYQEKLHTAEVNLKNEIDRLNSNIKKLENFIKFLESLSSIDYDDIKVIIKNINDLSTKLSNIESFKKAKKEYATERKNILKYIYLLRKVNKMNVTNMCVVCMDNPVSHFINPCGHTFCSKCIENHLEMEDITNNDSIPNDKKCPVCRKYVNNVNPLYFL